MLRDIRTSASQAYRRVRSEYEHTFASRTRQKGSLPVRSIAGNLVFSEEDAWACFRVQTRSYAVEPPRRRAALAAELRAFSRTVEADFQLLRVSRSFDAETFVARLSDQTPEEAHGELYEDYLREQGEVVSQLGAHTPAVFLCVRLSAPARDVHGRASRVFDRGPRESIVDRATTARDRVASYFNAAPATTAEIQWLIRRSFSRGVAEPREAPEDGDPERAVRRWFGESVMEHRFRHLRVFGEDGDCWQAGLCLGEMDHAAPFSRAVELMFTPVDEQPWPIDAALNVKYVPNDQAIRRVEHQVARTHNQLMDEQQRAHGARGEGHRRVALSEELHDHLTQTGEPLLDGTLSFMVSAESHEELSRRVRAFREGFPWPLYRPYGSQLDVWRQHLPGQPPRVAGFGRPFTCRQVGAMVPQATHEAGSRGGRALYVARTTSGHYPVFLDLAEGTMTDRAPTIALVGSLGGGKTIALQLLLWQAFLQGARIVDVDPKGDHLFHLMPEVAPHARVIYLGSSDEHRGRLDPLRVAPAGERHDAATTFLIDVIPPVDAPIQAAINGAVTRVINEHGERACCMAVVDTLLASDGDELRAGKLLGQYCDGGIVRLGFARLEDPLPSRAEAQVTYLQIRALRRAAVDTVRSEMSQSQRHSRAVLQLVALYAMKMLSEEPTRLKVLSFDEASFLAQDAVGQQLLDTLARWGRSEFAIPILSTQLLGDVEDQDNLIGQWLLFAMRSREHAVQALRMLDLDEHGHLVEALTERYGQTPESKGMAIYRDLQGNTEEIKIDLGRNGLLAALSPARKSSRSAAS